ncbi:MAG: Ni/Fe-hydrogenase cytochrome b subunit [Thermoproteota archaeon]|nr:MAG: Ni/Fe-hydrogenase cytochrome b subunit [Candidatus Korarchaeota archaeon]
MSVSKSFMIWTSALILVIAFGAYGAFLRLTMGFKVTALNDYYPWGLWIAYDVLTGIALAAGSFSLAFGVYIINKKKFEPLLRPTLLTCLLAYLTTALGLIIDINQPARFWHPMFPLFFQPHSVLFEVYWCISLYIIIQLIEFSPIVAEKLRWKWFYTTMESEKVMIPLVIVGIIVPTLHQSSLGGLFLIAPDKVHPLWYSPILPILFYISALAAAPAMIIIESNISSRVLNRGLELDLLSSLGRAMRYILLVYVAIRLLDLIARGAIFSSGDTRALFFFVEILAGFVAPLILLLSERFVRSGKVLLLASILVVFGVIMNRFDVLLTAWLYPPSGAIYFPTWVEISVTGMLVALEALAFTLAVKYLPIFPEIKREHA